MFSWKSDRKDCPPQGSVSHEIQTWYPGVLYFYRPLGHLPNSSATSEFRPVFSAITNDHGN